MVLVKIALPLAASCARDILFRRSGFYIIRGRHVLAEEWAKAGVTQCAVRPAERVRSR
jgi:hypothetical protein